MVLLKNMTCQKTYIHQGSKNPLVRSYLRVPQAAGQVKFWMIPNVNQYFIHIYANNFCDAGQVPILRYFKACTCSKTCVKRPQKLVFKTNYHLMQVKSIAEPPRGEFCNTFDLH